MATYQLISSVTVGSGGASSIDFTSIPNTYTDLKLVFSLREATTTNWTTILKLNGTTTNYSQRYLQGNGAAASSTTQVDFTYIINSSGATASSFGNGEVYIPNYAGSNNKSLSGDSVSETNATTAYARLSAELWSNIAAITSLGLTTSGGNLAQYSTAYLYGIKNS